MKLRLFSPEHATVLLLLAGTPVAGFAQAKTQPDTIIFTNGDQLTGKLVREASGSVVFHSDIAGDITVTWDKIKELHSAQTFAVLKTGVIPGKQTHLAQIPQGTLSVEANSIHLESPGSGATIATIPTANAAYIIDKTTLDKQLLGHPGFLQGWNGSATGGVTIVSATQNQYTVNAAVALQRVVPSVDWLNPRNRTTVAVNESFGKITEPAYFDPTAGVFVPSTFTKSNIFDANAERDQYVSQRFYYLGLVDFSHNFSQSLQLQQIYGGGVGYTVIKRPKETLDVKALLQYERQSFFNTLSPNKDLIGATFAADYNLTIAKGIIFSQQVGYIPAFNDWHAYSATESDALTFPAYKNFGFTVGTLDSYLNDAPITLPPTKRNSFQFTMGVTYAIKSKY